MIILATQATLNYIANGEWLPLAAQESAKKDLLEMDGTVFLSSGVSVPCERKNGSLTFDMTGNEGVDFAVLPYVWYKGYAAEDKNGQALDVSMAENGLVQVDMRGAEGRISVEYKLTAVRIISYFITAAAVVSLIILAGLSRRKRPRHTVGSVCL